MTKYKLIKWYPSLPKGLKEGDVVDSTSSKLVNWGYTNPDLCVSGKDVPIDEVENNPEFWEPIEEKDYEILSVIHKQLGVTKFSNHYLGKGKYDWNIHSVKRKDGEIFAVGDKVTYSKREASYKNFVIDHFFIRGDNKLLARNQQKSICEYIEHIKHVKQPLFVSEDGYDVYEGDEYWWVNKHSTIPNYVASTTMITKFIAFKKEENAEQWIEDNKPRYSKKDIEEALEKSFRGYYGYEGLYAIEKSKFLKELKK